MKTFAAYNVAPKALFDSLKTAGQPVLEIRYRGPERALVALACVCLGDSANDTAVRNILTGHSDQAPEFKGAAEHIAALADGIGQRMQVFK